MSRCGYVWDIYVQVVGYVQGVRGMSRESGYVCRYVFGWVGMSKGMGIPWDIPRGYTPPLVLTPSGGHQNTYGWQVDGTHPTGMLYCFIALNTYL